MIPYDVPRLRELLVSLIAGRGTLRWWDTAQRASVLMVPNGPAGSPIFLTVVADEAVMIAGLGATEYFCCAEAGDEKHLVEVIAAVVDGGATEWGQVDVDEQPFRTFLDIHGPFGSYTGDHRDAVKIRRLEPWGRLDHDADR